MRYSVNLLLFILLAFGSPAQNNDPFQMLLEPVIPPGFTGLHSYAWAKDGDNILLVGGRTDGLHRRQPFAAFDEQYNNTNLIVINLKKDKIWEKDISSLPASIAEQLQSSNMQFFQEDNKLILTGGYGYSKTAGNHITHPSLITIKVKELIYAILYDEPIQPFILQLKDERMAVTGGRLNQLNNLFYLVGGQRFDGLYNPHGPDHGPGFSQQYTNQIRKFNLVTIGEKLSIDNYSAITDSDKLHRRDYNLLLQLDATNKEILTLFSGVFQYGKDVPYTTLIDIDENGYREVPGFNQKFNHYHTASFSAYSKVKKTMYAVFLGGIAQYQQKEEGKITTDNNIPFVKTVSVIERSGKNIKEYTLKEAMPGYFGAAAEFIPATENLFTSTGILSLDKIKEKEVLIGYIIGGIDSRAPNVFWSNESDASRVSPVIWKVLFRKKM